MWSMLAMPSNPAASAVRARVDELVHGRGASAADRARTRAGSARANSSSALGRARRGQAVVTTRLTARPRGYLWFSHRQQPVARSRAPGRTARRTMKAVRSQEGGVTVVEVEQPPGIGEVLDMRATSVCEVGPDVHPVRQHNILGHELAGVRRTARRWSWRRSTGPGVRPVPAGRLQPVPDARAACPRHGAAGGWSTVPCPFRAPRLPALGARVRNAWVVEPARSRGTRCAWARPGPGKAVAVVGAGASAPRHGRRPRRRGVRTWRSRAAPPPAEAGERLGASGGAERQLRRRRGGGPPPGSLARCGQSSARAAPSSSSASTSARWSSSGCPCSTRGRPHPVPRLLRARRRARNGRGRGHAGRGARDRADGH